MANISLDVSGVDTTFVHTEGDTKQTEFLSWQLSRHLESMSTAGAIIEFVSNTEMGALETDISAYLQSIEDWVDSADAAIAAVEGTGNPPAIPDPPDLPVTPGEPLWMVILKMALRLLASLLLEWWRDRKKQNKNKGSDELVSAFKKAWLGIRDVQGTPTEYPLLQRVVDERNVKVSINDDQVVFWPGAMSIDVDEDVQE